MNGSKVFRFIGSFITLAFIGQVHGQTCYDSSIISPTPFMGNNSEVFKLANGLIGEVVAEYEYSYEYYPVVKVCPADSMMVLKGKRLNIRILHNPAIAIPPSISTAPEQPVAAQPSIIKSKIDDEFEGYGAGNLYELRNGQVWEQISARYRYRYKYAPDVTIINRAGRYEMQVEGMEDWVTVVRLK